MTFGHSVPFAAAFAVAEAERTTKKRSRCWWLQQRLLRLLLTDELQTTGKVIQRSDRLLWRRLKETMLTLMVVGRWDYAHWLIFWPWKFHFRPLGSDVEPS